jgi:hypothetical protein
MKKKLEAVNILLNVIGEPPLINEADYKYSYEAEQADKQVDLTKRKLLSEGFKFNRLTVTLSPDINGYISKPPNALVIEFADSKYTLNDSMVFDRENFTTKIEEPIQATIIYDEDFDYIPNVLQEYIIAQASIIYQRDMINDPSTDSMLERELLKATRDKNIWVINQTKANGKSSLFSRNTNPVGV